MSDGHPRTDEEPADATASGDDARSEAADREFDYRGWTLVVALFVSIVVIPGIIYLYPYVLGSLGLSFFGTYLMLPLVPAALLGLIAVWSMSAAT